MADRMASRKFQSKKEVWESFVNGEPLSFKSLFEAYYDEMYGYGIKLYHNHEVVKDCIQELFKTVWERREDLDHIGSPNVYLYVSLRRKIVKEQKRDKRNEELSEVNGETFLEFNKEDIIIVNEVKCKNKRKLKKALNQLTDCQKEVIYLYFYNGMSYGEIGKILSINRQSVRNHVYRAMETLRTLLDSKITKLVISLMITFFTFYHYFV